MSTRPPNTLVLGTVQLGLDYGVANRTGRPSTAAALAILEAAWAAGIRWYDTAPAYGQSEAVLGEFVRTHGVQREIRLLTKLPLLSDSADLRGTLRGSVERSLQALHAERVEVLFLHKVQDIPLLAAQPEAFAALLAEFPVGRLGASVYEPAEAVHARQSHLELAIQFPANLLDRRFAQPPLPGTWRFARSLLQQGLLAASELGPRAPERARQLFSRIRDYFAAHGVDRFRAALGYAVTASHFDYYLVGVETREQLAEILAAVAEPLPCPLPEAELTALFDWAVLDPRTW
jgi:aryl-alcohol dehydrogenase-like predicted oxidoreductase